MDDIANELAEFLVAKVLKTPLTQRFIVGIAGVPASGKSTLAQIVINKTNRMLKEHRTPDRPDLDDAVLVGLDGWHLTRAQLDAFPDPKLAHDRRGAHWTFDGEAYKEFVQQLREPLPESLSSTSNSDHRNAIYAPSFSHELKDPTPRAIPIYPHHRLVVIEGLYPFLNIEPWIKAGRLLDERWWVELGENEARKRLVARHVLSGVARDLEEAEWRARENDAPNGQFIKENMLEPTRIIRSIEDPILKSPSLA